jgi:hypothetical protein
MCSRCFPAEKSSRRAGDDPCEVESADRRCGGFTASGTGKCGAYLYSAHCGVTR